MHCKFLSNSFCEFYPLHTLWHDINLLSYYIMTNMINAEELRL